MKHIRFAIAALLAVWSGFAANAATKIWSGTVTVKGDAHDYDDIQLNGTVIINVTGGDYYLDGAISDYPGTSGKIIKIGSGKLYFRSDDTYLPTSTKWPGINTFTGGLELRVGATMTKGSASSSGPQEKANPFGYGQITLDFTGTTKPNWEYMGTITNTVVMNGDSTDVNGGWYIERDGGTGIGGPNYLKGDAYITGYTSRPDGTSSIGKMGITGENGTFGSIIAMRDNGAKCDLYFTGSTMFKVDGQLVAKTLDSYQRFYSSGAQRCESHYPGMFGGFGFTSRSVGIDIDLVRVNQGVLGFYASGAGGTPAIEFYGGLLTTTTLTSRYNASWDVGKVVTCGYITLNDGANTSSSSHTFKWLKSDYRDDTEPNYRIIAASGSGGADITFSGEVDTTAVCYFKVGQGVSIAVDSTALSSPSSFVQVFSNRTQSLSRAVTAKGGTLEFAACPFAVFNTFAVSDGGTLRFRDCDFSASENKLFTKTTTLTLDNGTLEVYGTGEADTLPNAIVIDNKGKLKLSGFDSISNTVSKLSIANGGTIELPSGSELYVTEFYVDGQQQRDGEYAQYGSGVTIKVRGAVFPTTTTKVWIGQGDNTYVTTPQNWDDGYGKPMTSIDFNFDQELKAIFAKGGTEAKLQAAETVFGAIDITNALDDTKTTFTLAGNGNSAEETRLTLYGAMSILGNSAALCLKNITIGTPYGIDQGAPSAYGEKTISLICDDTSRYHLYLTNAIIEKPMWFRGNTKDNTSLLYVYQSSTNEFKGAVYKSQGNWSTWAVQKNSQLTFSGGYTTDYKSTFNVYANSRVYVKNKPWKATGSGNGCLNFNGGYLQLAAEGNHFGFSSSDTTYRFQDGLNFYGRAAGELAFLDLTCNYALKSSRLKLGTYVDRQMIIDIHCTTQRVLQLYYGGSGGPSTDLTKTDYITGEEGSLLEVNNRSTTGHDSVAYINFRGGVGIRKLGAGSLTLKRGPAFVTAGLNNDHQSTGPLILESGTLTLDEGVTWKHASHVDISGGEFRVTENQALGRETILNLTGGKIYVPAGAVLWLSNAIINGEPVADGDYTASSEINPFEGYLTGDFAGTIRVCARGYMILYR